MAKPTEVVGVYYCDEGCTLEASYLLAVQPATHDDPAEVSVGDYRYRHTPDEDSDSTTYLSAEKIPCAECREMAEQLEGCEDMEIAGFEDVEEYYYYSSSPHQERAVG